ncbi:carbohydrate kinase family protein [Anaerobium acetethylicum]|uniref:Fructokinase n=1 Tax=Anaerobium acetethylicum TaxID=1619234 RepID=A0A1D3TX77_9FIRM|nr:carbohydrate kinase [Anaerobium acetethylicum]SCP98923.1 fructokinase [Anaerobium acetethylicum]
MNKKYDVVSLGELLIDFTLNGKSEQGNNLFEANPGGAPCNVLSMLSKLGKKTAFIGKVGEDQFGILLKEALDKIGISTENLVMDKDFNTTLAFVHTAIDGERNFSFYRKPGADMMLKAAEIKEELLTETKIFHFGTLSMTDDEVRKATKIAIKIAKKNGAIISFDPNLRPPLWDDLNFAKEQMIYGMKECDILKISDDELEFVTGCKDVDLGIAFVQQNYPIKLLFVTQGKDGSIACWDQKKIRVAGFPQENTVDTTGAGDTFCGCILNYILEHGLDNITKKDLEDMLEFANAAAALVTTRRGALFSMPEKEEVLNLIGLPN